MSNIDRSALRKRVDQSIKSMKAKIEHYKNNKDDEEYKDINEAKLSDLEDLLEVLGNCKEKIDIIEESKLDLIETVANEIMHAALKFVKEFEENFGNDVDDDDDDDDSDYDPDDDEDYDDDDDDDDDDDYDGDDEYEEETEIKIQGHGYDNDDDEDNSDDQYSDEEE